MQVIADCTQPLQNVDILQDTNSLFCSMPECILGYVQESQRCEYIQRSLPKSLHFILGEGSWKEAIFELMLTLLLYALLFTYLRSAGTICGLPQSCSGPVLFLVNVATWYCACIDPNRQTVSLQGCNKTQYSDNVTLSFKQMSEQLRPPLPEFSK